MRRKFEKKEQLEVTHFTYRKRARSATGRALSLGILFSTLLVLPVYAHDGAVDSLGCHNDKNRKDYHCHTGVFKLGSFDSKQQMLRILRLQFFVLGHPWVYDDATEAELASNEGKTQPLPAVVAKPKDNQKKPAKQPSGPNLSTTKRKLTPEPAKEKKAGLESAKPEETQSPKDGRQPMREWIVKITSDGNTIFENLHGERYYFDNNDRKVYVRRSH